MLSHSTCLLSQRMSNQCLRKRLKERAPVKMIETHKVAHHQTRCRRSSWVSIKKKKQVNFHRRATIASVLLTTFSKLIKIKWIIKIVSLMVNSNTRLNLHLRRRQIDLKRTVQMELWMTKISKCYLQKNILRNNWNNNRELGSSHDRRSRIDLESMTMTDSTFFQPVISLTRKDIISIRKVMTSLEDTMILWLVSIYQVQNMRIYLCKRINHTMQGTIEAQTRRIDLVGSTMVCMKILNYDVTMEASTLIRTTKASMEHSSTQISYQIRADTSLTRIWETDTIATPNKTSTEGTQQMGLIRSTHQQRIRGWTMAITMIKCLLAQRIRSIEIATISRTKSLSSRRSTRQTRTKKINQRMGKKITMLIPRNQN